MQNRVQLLPFVLRRRQANEQGQIAGLAEHVAHKLLVQAPAPELRHFAQREFAG